MAYIKNSRCGCFHIHHTPLPACVSLNAVYTGYEAKAARQQQQQLQSSVSVYTVSQHAIAVFIYRLETLKDTLDYNYERKAKSEMWGHHLCA